MAAICIFCKRRPAVYRDGVDGRLKVCKRCRPDPRAGEEASAIDRIYFEEHPDETEYVREALPKEFPPSIPPHDDAVRMVKVTQIAPGARIRSPFWFLPFTLNRESSPRTVS